MVALAAVHARNGRGPSGPVDASVSLESSHFRVARTPLSPASLARARRDEPIRSRGQAPDAETAHPDGRPRLPPPLQVELPPAPRAHLRGNAGGACRSPISTWPAS